MAAPMDPAFGQFVAPGQTADAPAGNPPPAPETNPELEAAQARIEDQQATIRDLATRPVQAPTAPQQPFVQTPLGPRPDPTTHPTEFNAWEDEKDRRTEQRTTAQIQATRDQAIQEVRGRDIVNEFLALHPSYAGLAQDVRAEMAGVVGRMGINQFPDDASEIHKLTEAAMKDKKARYTDTATISGEEAVKTPAPANRVEGTAGATSAPAAGPDKEPEEKTVGLIDALKASQEKSGFF